MKFPTLNKLVLAGMFFTTAAIFSMPAYAQRVQPMSYELQPSGSASTTALRIENTSQTSMTIELSVSKISLDVTGIETRSPAEDDFLIFPPQMILKAGKTQAVRVKYIGDPTIKVSQPYRISIKQVPIDMTGQGKSGVGMVVNFHTLAIVSPAKAKTDLVVESMQRNADGSWDLLIANKGTKLARLSKTEWTISDGKKEKSFKKTEVANLTKKNLILPESTLSLTIDAIDGFDPATSTVKIHNVR